MSDSPPVNLIAIDPQQAAKLDALVTRLACYFLAITLVTPESVNIRGEALVYDLDGQETNELRGLLSAVYEVAQQDTGGQAIAMVAVEASDDLSEVTYYVGFKESPFEEATQKPQAFRAEVHPNSWNNFYKRVMTQGLVLPEDVLYPFPQVLERLKDRQLILKLAPTA